MERQGVGGRLCAGMGETKMTITWACIVALLAIGFICGAAAMIYFYTKQGELK